MAGAAASDDVKLLGLRISPFTNRVQFALNLKSVDYDFIPENLADKSELLLKSNPVHKKIPVLIHGGKPICESLVIVQYIDDEFCADAPSILPSDPYARATARFWSAYIDDKWFPALRALSDAKDEESKAAVLEQIVQGMAWLEDVLVKCNNGKGFFGGDSLGLLDIVLGCFLGWLRVAEINSDVKILDGTKTPALLEWAENFKCHEAVKGTLPEAQELLDILRMMQANASQASK